MSTWNVLLLFQLDITFLFTWVETFDYYPIIFFLVIEVTFRLHPRLAVKCITHRLYAPSACL